MLSSLLNRRHNLSPVHDTFILPLRLIREALVAGEGKLEHWGEMAGMMNVCGLYAMEQRRDDWLHTIIPGADAMREIEARNARVGGRWVATEDEADALTVTINLIDETILKAMTTVDFIRLAQSTNRMAKETA